MYVASDAAPAVSRALNQFDKLVCYLEVKVENMFRSRTLALHETKVQLGSTGLRRMEGRWGKKASTRGNGNHPTAAQVLFLPQTQLRPSFLDTVTAGLTCCLGSQSINNLMRTADAEHLLTGGLLVYKAAPSRPPLFVNDSVLSGCSGG